MHTRTRTLTHIILAANALLALAAPTWAQKPTSAPPPPSAPGRPGGPGSTMPGRPGPGGQPGQGQGQRRGRGLALASLPVSLLDILTPLKADQKTKITAIQTKMKADLKTADRTTRGGIMTKATDDVKAVLTPAQTAAVQKALPTLALVNQSRAIPMGALGDVNLTKPQVSKISGITTPIIAQLKGLQGPARQAKMQQVGPPLKAQIESVLTQPQKDIIAKYVVAHPPRQRGMRGGPGGNPGAGPGVAGNRPPNGAK